MIGIICGDFFGHFGGFFGVSYYIMGPFFWFGFFVLELSKSQVLGNLTYQEAYQAGSGRKGVEGEGCSRLEGVLGRRWSFKKKLLKGVVLVELICWTAGMVF